MEVINLDSIWFIIFGIIIFRILISLASSGMKLISILSGHMSIRLTEFIIGIKRTLWPQTRWMIWNGSLVMIADFAFFGRGFTLYPTKNVSVFLFFLITIIIMSLTVMIDDTEIKNKPVKRNVSQCEKCDWPCKRKMRCLT